MNNFKSMKKGFKLLGGIIGIIVLAIIGFSLDKNYTNQIVGSRTGPTKLSNLSDVSIYNVADAELLVWQASTSNWINGTASVDLSGYLSTTTASSTYAKLAGAVFSGAISATNLSGTNTGNESTSTIGTLINGSIASTTPDDTDRFSFSASSLLRYITWANIKTSLKSYFDSLDTTLTNKRVTPRIGSVTASTSLTIDSNLYDQFYITDLTATTTFSVPSGTPTNGQKLLVGITASTTAQGLVWTYTAGGFATSTDLALPNTTVANKTMYLGFVYNTVVGKWRLLALLNNF